MCSLVLRTRNVWVKIITWVPFESYKSKGMCSFVLKFWKELHVVWHIKNKNLSAYCLFSNSFFFLRAILVWSLHISLILSQKCSVTFHWIDYGKSQTQFFSALGPETIKEQIEYKWKPKFTLTCSFQKVTQVFAVRKEILAIVW